MTLFGLPDSAMACTQSLSDPSASGTKNCVAAQSRFLRWLSANKSQFWRVTATVFSPEGRIAEACGVFRALSGENHPALAQLFENAVVGDGAAWTSSCTLLAPRESGSRPVYRFPRVSWSKEEQ